MRNMYKLAVVLLCACCCLACEKEDKLVSRFEFKLGSFEFPQGDDEWDHKIMEIFETYNARIIYKDITAEDLDRSWTGGGGTSSITFDFLDESEILDAVNEVEKRVLTYLPANMRDALMPPYIYLGKNYAALDQIWGMVMGNYCNLDGMDNWIISFVYCAIPGLTPEVSIQPVGWATIVWNIYEKARTKGVFSIPVEFSEGVDYETPFCDIGNGNNITDEMKSDPNYYLNRGFVENLWGGWSNDESSWQKLGLNGNVNPHLFVGSNKDYLSFLRIIFTKPESFIRERYKGYEKVLYRFDVLYKLFDNMGVDLRKGGILE